MKRFFAKITPCVCSFHVILLFRKSRSNGGDRVIVLRFCLNHIYGFEGFEANFTYPKKVVDSLIGEEYLAGRERFRYKKAVVLMGANATGKTSLGRALLRVFSFIETGNQTLLTDMASMEEKAAFTLDFVNSGFVLHRLTGEIDRAQGMVTLRYLTAEISKTDSYETAARKLKDRTGEAERSPSALKKLVGPLRYRFAYPEIEGSLRLTRINQSLMLKTLRAVIGTLDPSLTDIVIAKDLKDSFIIRRGGQEIIIQDGKLLNREALSSGTAEGVDVAVFLAAMMARDQRFYYCDEHFSYIQSDLEKRIFGIMMGRLGPNDQLIFTTHNTDMLELNLPKHAFAFLRKKRERGVFRVSMVSASDMLKRNTDSVRCAVENDVFSSLPDDSLLDELEAEEEA